MSLVFVVIFCWKLEEPSLTCVIIWGITIMSGYSIFWNYVFLNSLWKSSRRGEKLTFIAFASVARRVIIIISRDNNMFALCSRVIMIPNPSRVLTTTKVLSKVQPTFWFNPHRRYLVIETVEIRNIRPAFYVWKKNLCKKMLKCHFVKCIEYEVTRRLTHIIWTYVI